MRRCPSRDTSWTRDGTEWNRGIPKQYRVKSRQRRDHCIIILMMTSSFLVFSWWCCRTCVCHSRITVFSFFLFETGDPLDPFDNCVIDSYHYVITVFIRSNGTVTFQRYNYVITVQLCNREKGHPFLMVSEFGKSTSKFRQHSSCHQHCQTLHNNLVRKIKLLIGAWQKTRIHLPRLDGHGILNLKYQFHHLNKNIFRELRVINCA